MEEDEAGASRRQGVARAMLETPFLGAWAWSSSASSPTMWSCGFPSGPT